MKYEIEDSQLNPEDIPEPVGFRILIEPLEVKKKTEGGIILTEQSQEAERLLNYMGRVIAMGPRCYQHAAKFQNPLTGEIEPWCRVGDIVVYGQHVGQTMVVYGKDRQLVYLKIINDDDVRVKVSNPNLIMTYL